MKKQTFKLFVVLAFIALFCAPLPTDNEAGKHTIRLSLEKIERDSAVFSGEPIRAIVETGESTYFSTFAWHTGMGKLIIPEQMINKYAKQFEVYLYWKNYPSRKDVALNSYYDTVFITVGGNLKESNKTRVRVTNLPVTVDSVLIGDTVFNGEQKIWKYMVRDKNSEVPIRFYARDLDGKIPDITYSGNKGTILQSSANLLQMTYMVPTGNFNDTIHYLIFDHLGGNEYRDLNIKRYAANLPPVIDSIVFEDTILKGSNLYHIGFPSIDTLKLQAYVHDPEGTDVSCTWKAYASSRIKSDLVRDNKIMYVCTTGVCRQVHKDTTILIDTIKIVVKDVNNDSAVVKIEVVKGDINYPPYFEKILINDSIFAAPETLIVYPIEFSSSYRVKIKAGDPEDDSLEVKWTGVPLAQLSEVSDTGAVFTSSEAQLSDTLSISISDNDFTVIRKVLLLAPENRENTTE